MKCVGYDFGHSRPLPGHLKWPDTPKIAPFWPFLTKKNAFFAPIDSKNDLVSFHFVFRRPQCVRLKAETFARRMKCVGHDSGHFRPFPGHLKWPDTPKSSPFFGLFDPKKRIFWSYRPKKRVSFFSFYF
jgi:hypothetical protein